MTKFIKSFANDEAGAVTVDWVVLTAAVVGLGIAVFNALSSNATGLAGNIGTYMDNQDPN